MQSLFGKNKRECPEPIKAEVKGQIPAWLQGTLLRNGPGMHTVGETSYNHWFDGLALMHSFTFKDGEVFYQSKYLRSDTYKKNMEANRIVVSEFGTMAYPDPCKNIFSKAFSYLSHTIPEFTDNCLINIMKCGEDYYAVTETNFIRKIDPKSLDTLEKVDYTKYIALNLASSHPHYDAAGDTINMGTSIADKGKTKYLIVKIPNMKPVESEKKKKVYFKNLEVLCSIPSHGRLNPSYYHSFGITENYIVFVEQPFKLDLLKLATAYFRGINWASCLNFHSEDKTFIHIIDRRTKTSVSTKFHTDALVLYHHVNAYEEDGHVVFDVIAYNDSSLYDMFYLANVRQESAEFEAKNTSSSKPACRRFVIPLQPDKDAELGTNLVKLASTTADAIKEKDSIYCHPEILVEDIELPRINYNYNGKKYRYIYVTGIAWKPIPTKIVKFDTLTRKSVEWQEEDCWPAEPVFVPSPDAKEEDDGIVLSSIVCTSPNKFPFLLILDAKTFTELARASINADVHLDLHGYFIPEKN
ncbi:beta,beta-carotene 15,15'-dioxygenase [Latimeria chalumnae]|uniref:Beta-carotene oxygenase 1 n=1 Tax=Latimeria chalumnae TaxID=7897 RepID=M3XIH1_LATCH|nr:PREDICTED: beta,beta-carotene 15,15'-monooxygenase [Latimeria chalumnae]|eukprot:XP_006004911.1 PREDICTED: beta,beta-carotene 15,15'-monooxygenase [Latimeria chalumnae]